jgi:outer membrane protein assembly factor BamB
MGTPNSFATRGLGDNSFMFRSFELSLAVNMQTKFPLTPSLSPSDVEREKPAARLEESLNSESNTIAQTGFPLPIGWAEGQGEGSAQRNDYDLVIRGSKLIICALLLLIQLRSQASEWPQFLGPNRNGSYTGPAISESWPKDGPRTLWTYPVGEGFAGPVVSEGKVIIFHRKDDKEIIDCLTATNGKPVWSFSYPTAYRDDFGFEAGPRATPAIADGFIYTMGAEGTVHCVQLGSGKDVWSVATKEKFGASKGFFGMACSPLVEANQVLLDIGGENGAGIVAFDKTTGKLRWKSTDDQASYSSPVAADFEGKPRVLFFTRAGLVAIEPSSGTVVFQYPWRSRMNASVNAAAPLVIGNFVFLSASYNTGAILLQIKNDKPEKIWSGDDILSNHYATSVYHEGYLYGFDGRQEYGPAFVCVELKTGKSIWREEHFGSGTVTLAGKNLLVLRENGELLLAPANPEKFTTKSRAQILGGQIRPYPALADAILFARDKTKLVAVDLR